MINNQHIEGEVISFIPLTVNDKDLYQKFYLKEKSFISDLSFNSRIAWLSGFDYHYAIVKDSLILSSQSKTFTGLHFSMPLGLKDARHFREIVDELWYPYAELNAAMVEVDSEEEKFALKENNCVPFMRFLYFCESKLAGLEDAFQDEYEIKIFHRRAYSDYIYARDKLATLSGKNLRTRRNHWNKFAKTYTNFDFHKFSTADIEAALALSFNWCKDKGLNPYDISKSDYLAIEAYLKNFKEIDAIGSALYVNNKLIAFSLGSQFSHQAVTHFEKADDKYEGAYAAINKLTAEFIYNNDFINREEDMGNEGLRKVKEAYRPIKLIPKYEIFIKKK